MLDQTISGRYHIETLLGRGGMGAVYQATDSRTNQRVALKVLHFLLDSEAKAALTRFHREFRVLTRLDHPHIVRALAYGTHEDSPYLVLEYLAGHTLFEDLAAGKPLAYPRLLAIARQICDALIYLHQRSIVHRDLKPGNLMVDARNDSVQVKLMDFGLVRQTNLSLQLTQEGVALGTVAYMSPEQAQGIPVDFRSDLYSLGAILYEMATGRTPFLHDNPAMMLMQQLTAMPPSPRQINPDIGPPLEQLILDLLAKEPSQRPASTEQVAARLAQLSDETVPVIGSAPKRVDLIPRVPLIGRDNELHVLSQIWAKAQAGQRQIVFISGVAGAGKTRLVTEASVQAQLGDGRFLRGYCQEHGSLPYEPLPKILDQLLHDLPASVREGLPPELTRLLAGQVGPDPDSEAKGTAPTDPTEARVRLFAGFAEILRQAAQKQPLMIAVEDTQWKDPTLLDLRGYLSHQLSETRLMFIITFRPEEIGAESAHVSILESLQRDGEAQLISLDLLNRDQVGYFLKAALGENQIPETIVDRFHQATGGNPLFIEETLKALASEGQVAEWIDRGSNQLATSSNISLELPQNVLAVAERRLQSVASADRPIVMAAAVIGSEFDFSLLAGVTGLDEDTLLDAIDRLLASRLIIELPMQDGEDRYRFAQEALRQAVLRTVSRRRRRSLHRRTSETMIEVYDTSQPRYWPILAHHFAGANRAALATKYFRLAGDGAARIYANAEAVAYYSEAIELALSAETDTGESQLEHLFTSRGRNLELSGQFEAALANYTQMLEVADQRGDEELRLASLLAQATIRSIPTPVHDVANGEILSQQALSLARALGDQQAEAKALWNLLLVYRNTDHPRQAVEHGEQSIALARKHDFKEQLAYSLNDIPWAYLATGQPERAKAALEEARDLWRALGNQPMLVDNLFITASHLALQGDSQAALALTEEAKGICRSINNLWNLAQHRALEGYIFLETGQISAALAAFEESLQVSERAGAQHLQIAGQVDLGWVHAFMGDIEHAVTLGRQAVSRTREMLGGWKAFPLALMARLYVLSGNLDAAEAVLQEAYVDFDPAESGIFAIFWINLADAEIALAKKAYHQVQTKIEQYTGQLHQMGIRVYVIDGLIIQGKAYLEDGQLDRADQVLSEARLEAAALESRRTLWPVLFLLSQLEARRGNLANAEAYRQQAGEVIRYIANHAPPDLRRSFLELPPVQAVLADKPT
jgi:predicted ATPase